MKTKKNYGLLVGTIEEKKEYEQLSNTLKKCEKKCSKEKKKANKQDIKNHKIFLKKKCNMDPTLNYKFDAYNQVSWTLGDKYLTSPCIEYKQHLINDPSNMYAACVNRRCKKEKDALYKNKQNCIIS
jgi:hypothetical protein